MTNEDIILAFFPCTRFEVQEIMNFKGNNSGMNKWDLKRKLELDLRHDNELHQNYQLITKLVIICLDRNLKLIIENPYSTQHYLIRYWAKDPDLIIYNRRELGDNFVKPTMFYFINYEPQNNFIFEPQVVKPLKTVIHCNTIERSMISKEFANRFIREFILPKEEFERIKNEN